MFKGQQAASSSFSLSPDQLKVNESDPSARLGQGGFGIVFKGTYRLAPAAIKQFLVQDDLPPEKMQELFQEAEIMATLHHPNIIQFYGYTQTKPYRIVMEFMPKGSLYRVLHNKSEELSWAQRIGWGIEIGAGLHYLHTCQPVIIHRDLKSLNVLISQDNQAKLTDFGLALAKLRTSTATLTSSRKTKKQEEPTGAVGSLRWMAPELFSLKPKYSKASDIFAYAIVLWEMAAREIPYAQVSADSVIQGAVMQGEREEIDSKWPDVLSMLIQACWDPKPDQRPSAEIAVEKLQTALSELKADDTQQAIATISLQEEKKTAPPSRGYALASEAAATSTGYALASEAPKAVPSARPTAPKPQQSAEKAKAPSPVKAPVTALFRPKPAAKAAVSQADVEKLLLHVARGEQEEAEAMLKIKGNEALLLQKGKVTDYSNRTFKNITAFQYALWALDWHMWKMLLNYLPDDEAKAQLLELESKGTEHGQHYDFSPLIQAYRTYLDRYDYDEISKVSEKRNEIVSLWIKVGDTQTQAPAHVANEYCRRDRSFRPKPSFTEVSLPRSFKMDGNHKFFPPSPSHSHSYGAARGRFHDAFFSCHLDARSWPGTSDRCGPEDLVAISGLCEVRTEQYQALKRKLTATLAARPR